MTLLRNLLEHILGSPRNLIVAMIAVYQYTLSPDHGALKSLHPFGYCRHTPTCSMYAKEQIKTRGVIIGGLLTIKRLASCHPWSKISDEKALEMLQTHN